MRLRAALRGDLQGHMKRQRAAAERAVTRGVRQTTDDLKGSLRKQVQSAGLGNKLSKTWRDQNYPRQGASLGAAGIVYTKAPEIMRGFTESGRVRANGGQYLAIPTEAAPKFGEGRSKLTPATFPESRFGKLRFVNRRRGPPLLVVNARITKTGRASAVKSKFTKSGRLRKGVATVVMFVLLREVRLRPRLDLDGSVRRAVRDLPRNILRHWDDPKD